MERGGSGGGRMLLLKTMLWRPSGQSKDGHGPTSLCSEHCWRPEFISWPFSSRWKLMCWLYSESPVVGEGTENQREWWGSQVWGGSRRTNLRPTPVTRGLSGAWTGSLWPQDQNEGVGWWRCQRCPKRKWSALGGRRGPQLRKCASRSDLATVFVAEILTADGGLAKRISKVNSLHSSWLNSYGSGNVLGSGNTGMIEGDRVPLLMKKQAEQQTDRQTFTF